MKRISTACYTRPIALYLAFALIVLSSLAGPAEAMLLPAQQSAERTADLAAVQKTLELKLVQQRLLDYGLTPEETAARLGTLPDEQLHQLAANLDAVQAGGDVASTLFALVVIAALVVLIIFMLQGRIAIEKK